MHPRLIGQKVLVVGPGWLGGAVVSALRAAGAQVWTLRRGAETQASVNDMTTLSGDVREAPLGTADWLSALPPALDHVVACIAPGRGPGDEHRTVYPPAVAGAIALAVRTQARSLLYTSSTGVYGRRDGAWVRESDPLHATDARQGALIDAEQLLQVADAPSLARTILRPAGLYGPERDPAVRYRSGIHAGEADVWTNFSWRDDVVSAVLRSLVVPPDAGACAIYNCTDGVPLRSSVISRALGVTEISPSGHSTARSNQRVSSERLRSSGWIPSMTTVLDGLAALGHRVDRRVLSSHASDD